MVEYRGWNGYQRMLGCVWNSAESGSEQIHFQEDKIMTAAAGKFRTVDLVYIAVFAVLMAICSWISIPATVPFTLQTMGVFLAVSILGGRRGTLSVLVYILLGAVGLPVFAGFTGGIGILLGSTGGYIIGFLFSALAMWGIEHFFECGRITLAISMLIGLAICYAFGTVWFMVVYTRGNGPVSLAAVLGWCVIPFLLPDLIKIAIALLIGPKIRKLAMIH